MSGNKVSTATPALLRQRAEGKARLDKATAVKPLSREETEQLLHDLRVHQIELEMQNEELRSQQAELQSALSLYELAPICYMILNEKGVIQEANGAATALFGMARHLLLNKPITNFICDKDQDIYYQFCRKPAETDGSHNCDIRLMRADSAMFWAHLQTSVVHKCTYGITLTDISERKQLELDREEAVSRLQKIANRVPGMVYKYRLFPDGRSCFPFASEAIREIYRLAPEDVREDASKIFAVIHPDDLNIVVESIHLSARDLAPWHQEYRVQFDNGTVRWLLGNALPELEKGGAVLWHGFISDITARKQAEIAFYEQEQFIRATIDGLSAHICVINSQGRIIITNCAWNAFGVENNAAENSYGVGSNYLEACRVAGEVTKDVEETVAGIRSVIAGTLPGFVKEYPCHSPVERRWFCCRVNPCCISGVLYAVISHENITERILTEEHLRDTNEKYRAVFDNANDAIFICNERTEILAANPLAAERLGYSHSELVSMKINQVDAPDENQYIPERVAHVMKDGQLMFETNHLCKDGSIIPVEVNARRIVWDGQPAVMSFCRDITERKLVFQSRLAAMGDLISAIAHQWRQPLATLGMIVQRTHAVGGMQMLTADHLKEFKDSAMRQIKYMSDTIDEFRNFYHLAKEKLPFSPCDCISDAVKLIEPQLTGSVIMVHTDFTDCAGQKSAGLANEFKQVILNLLVNARDAIQERRNTRNEPVVGRIDVKIIRSKNRSMTIDISDNGCGVSDEIAPRIFAHYFTTKHNNGGTGIGLYMSRMIVEQSFGGNLYLVQSDEGAIFRIELPLENTL